MLHWKIFHWYHLCFPESNRRRPGCEQGQINQAQGENRHLKLRSGGLCRQSQLKYFRCSQYQWKAQPQVPSAQTAGQATPRSAWPLWVMLATDFQQFEEFSLRLKKPQGITDRHTADISNHHRDNTSIPKLGKVQVAIRLESCVALWPFSTAQRSECVSTYRVIS